MKCIRNIFAFFMENHCQIKKNQLFPLKIPKMSWVFLCKSFAATFFSKILSGYPLFQTKKTK